MGEAKKRTGVERAGRKWQENKRVRRDRQIDGEIVKEGREKDEREAQEQQVLSQRLLRRLMQ